MGQDTEIAARLRLAMKARGIGTETLAGRIGRNQSYVRDILLGRSRSPQGSGVNALAEELDVPVDWLLGSGPRILPAVGPAAFCEPPHAIEWRPPEHREGDNRPDLEKAISAFCPRDARPGYLTARMTLPAFSIVSGDLIVIDLKRGPVRGELVAVNQADEETGNAATLFRRWLDPLLVPPDQELRSHAGTAEAARCRPVIAVIRAPGLTEPDGN